MSWKNSCRDGFSRWHILRSYVQLHVILCCIDVQVHARHQPAFRAYDHSTSILFFAFPCNPELCAWIGTRRWSRICWSQEWPNSDTSQSESTQDYPSSLITELSKLSIMIKSCCLSTKTRFFLSKSPEVTRVICTGKSWLRASQNPSSWRPPWLQRPDAPGGGNLLTHIYIYKYTYVFTCISYVYTCIYLISYTFVHTCAHNGNDNDSNGSDDNNNNMITTMMIAIME